MRQAKKLFETNSINKFQILTVFTGIVLCALSVLYAAETEQPQPAQQPNLEEPIDPSIPRAPTPIPVEERTFLYTGEGTRDPFVPLTLHRDLDATVTGLAAMNISDITILGIQIGLGTFAMVRGADGKAYNMEVGQTLMDGELVAIEPGKVVYERAIRDSFGREIDKETIEYYLHR